MSRKLIIDGNALYVIDEDCMLRQRVRDEKAEKSRDGKYGDKEEESEKRNRL